MPFTQCDFNPLRKRGCTYTKNPAKRTPVRRRTRRAREEFPGLYLRVVSARENFLVHHSTKSLLIEQLSRHFNALG